MSETFDNRYDRQPEPYPDGDDYVDSGYASREGVTADDGEPDELDDDLPDVTSDDGEATGDGPDDNAEGEPTDRAGEDPPTDPPVGAGETTSPGERGIALQRVLDYTAVADEQVHDSIVDRVTGSEYGAGLVDHLTAQGATLDEAVTEISRIEVDGVTLGDMVEDEELVFAKTQYGDALESCGLDLHIEDGVALEMAEPGAFVAALRETPTPADSGEQSQLLAQTPDLIHFTLVATSAALIVHNPEDAAYANGGVPPPSAYSAEISPPAPTQNELVVASTLSQHAGPMAIELDRLGVPEHAVDAMRQLALAKSEDLIMHWAVGHDIKLLGHNPMPLGLDRYTTVEEWGQAYRYLERLHDTAPDSLFSREVRGTIMDDLEAALSGPDPIEPPRGSDITEEARARWIAARAERRAATKPLLREAQYRIPRIFRGQR